MSTSRSRLTRSIQEIAKRDPDLRRAIEATKPRGDQPSSAGVGTSDAERDRICCDGSTNDSANPGTEDRDTSDGGQDASDGLNSDDPADIGDMGPGSLTGLHDCATGEPVCFEGSDWVPPDGWDSPTEPSQDQEWVANPYEYWENASNPGNKYRTKGQAKNATQADVESAGLLYCGAVTDTDTILEIEATGPTSTCSNGYLVAAFVLKTCPPSTNDAWCGTDYGNPDNPYPPGQEWPSDSCVNLAIKSGSIVGSKYDPENDGTYSKPMSEIKLCDGFGNSFYLRPSAGGGWKSISDLTTGPDGHLYDSTGMQIRRISHDEFTDSTV